MKIKIFFTNFCLIFVGCLLLSSCAYTTNNFKNSDMDFSSIQKVAILPFQNLTSDDNAAERVRETFMGMLQATRAVYVVPPGEVARAINLANMHNPSEPSAAEIKTLANILKVQAVVTGVLKEYGSVHSGASEANVISIQMRMLETETGTVVWSASSTKGGITIWDRLLGGGGKPMDVVTEAAINDLLNKLFK